MGCIAILAAASCARHQVDPAPAPLVEAPTTYSIESTSPEELQGAWWLSFSDPTLNELMDTALAQNITVAQALERIDRAEALLRQAHAIRMPQVAGTADVEERWDRTRLKDDGIGTADKFDDAVESYNEFVSSVQAYREAISTLGSGGGEGGNGGGGSQRRIGITDLRRPESSGPPEGWSEDWETEYSSGLSVSWEADLWGRLRSAARAQAEEYAAAIDDYEALRLLLTSQVADAYYLALEQRLQYALLLEQRDSAETLLELIELRFLQGSASVVDVLQQKGQLAEIDAEVPIVRSQLRVFENRLDVLLGVAPDGADRTPETGSHLPGETALPAVGVPVGLLENRPDLRAMKRRVVAADYRIASAIAERLPRLTLTGSLEFGDTSIASSLTGAGGAGLFQPLLDWGLRKAAVDEARSDFRDALLEYTQGYLLAIEEVESALWREARQRELIEALAARESILQQTLNETRVRYGLGVTDYLPVLTAIQDLQDIQRELLTERRALVSLRIGINRAVGGPVPDSGRTAQAAAPPAKPGNSSPEDGV